MIDRIFWASSLEKVFPEKEPKGLKEKRLSFFKNERFSLQCVFHASEEAQGECQIHPFGGLEEYLCIRQVWLMPSRYPGSFSKEAGQKGECHTGLYPDLLRKISDGEGLRLYPGQWHSLFVTVELPEDFFPENRDGSSFWEMGISISQKGVPIAKSSCEVEILPEDLPPQRLIHTEWFHGDCLADYYQVPVWSKEHWRLLENFMGHYAKMGMNMILVPAFTPPLDTGVGKERTTIQLVQVRRRQGRWMFGFERLHRFLDMADRAGIRYFEFAHLFTQWGAKAAPKIVGEEDGKICTFFGWDTDSMGQEYLGFLEEYLKALNEKLKEWGMEERVYFHLSDEPEEDALKTYTSLKKRLEPLFFGRPLIDALSDYRFFSQGGVDIPVVGIEKLNPFLENSVSPLFVYYCGCHVDKVPNRLFAMASSRNRILGVLLYIYQIQGFLHWGYNFYNTQFSTRSLNPYQETDAGGGFPSGDSFLVYPGRDGYPEDSIRMQVLLEAVQDLRALELCESRIGRERVVQLIQKLAGGLPTMREYPEEPEFLLDLRQEVNRQIHRAGEPS